MTQQKNEIVKVEISGNATTGYNVAVTKTFAPEYGGGSQVFTESAGKSLHCALDVARGMVTWSPGTRTDAYPATDHDIALSRA